MKPANPKQRAIVAALLVGLLPTLAGCFGAAVVGAGAGVLMIADRRPSDTYIADEAIELRAGNRISEKYRDKVHVNTTSYNRTVLLTGEVPDTATKNAIEQIVAEIPNVKAIQNELQVAGISSLAARGNDAYLTSKVKARFIDGGKFPPNHVKVVTEAGTVYLMGLVTQNESAAAADLARTTSGVRRVVRMFEVITDEQARQIDNRPPEKASAAPRE